MRARLLLFIVPVVAALAAACQGSTVSAGGGGAGGACIAPTGGEACTMDASACQPLDPCCAGYEWVCDTGSHQWQKSALGCACQKAVTSFSCGTTTCNAGEICLSATPGTAPPGGGGPFYTCHPIPASCGPAPTCACISASLSKGGTLFCGQCFGDGAGHLTIDCGGA